ncbi:MAG: kinase/pyrophosphorylase [Firmicutes bacterium]|nr:kinase/pyrophosphorylase [Bacillota bacterium]
MSDAAGETAEFVARAAAAQFDGSIAEIRRVPYVSDEETIRDIIEEAAAVGASMIFTLVVPALRNCAIETAQQLGVRAIDVLGPVIDALTEETGLTPRWEPGLTHRLDDDYFRRVEAIEFAVKYDDGKDVRGLMRADVVLIGVSRTSKTPLSMYLAHQSLKVANVPLVPEVPPSPELFTLPRKRIFGLTIDPYKLADIRRERLRSMGLDISSNYADLGRIVEELQYADQVMKRLGCLVIDVTNRAVEETAALILSRIQRRSAKS